MGTRADFYIGRGENAEWLGSIAWDGHPTEPGHGVPIVKAQSEYEYRWEVENLSRTLDHWTSPEQGWPWPWEDSHTTDFSYAWDDGVYVSCFGYGWRTASDVARQSDEDIWTDPQESTVFPNMKAIQNVTRGRRSGVMMISRAGPIPAKEIDEWEAKQ